jgi:predicted thioesterase
MKPGLQVGHTYEFSVQVEPEMQAQFGGQVIHPLYSTAAMIAHMEWASRQHILPYLEAGEEGVGHRVDVTHLAPTPVGATVTIRSTVEAITAKRVVSHVEAWHQQTRIGAGHFEQALVPLATLYGQVSSLEAGPVQTPPPAELVSTDGQRRISLEILKWETGLLPCTRYDEWLVCRARVDQPHYEGAFLLHYELTELRDAMLALGAGERSGYESDFLESVLNVKIATGEPGEWDCTVQLAPPAEDGGACAARPQARFTVSTSTLKQFAARLTEQLAGFPSRL